MATKESINEKSYMEFLTIKESLSIYLSETERPLLIQWKRWTRAYVSRDYIYFMKMIDLSSNYLTQSIPVEIGKLVELRALNLSRNQLVGYIPSSIGEMENMEVLDLSRNRLSCVIPISIVNLNFLDMLDLSYNTLSGKIPYGEQLITLDNDSYQGNPRLCGLPLTKACPKSENISFEDAHCSKNEGNIDHGNDDNHEENRINPFYITMAAGFFTGFWAFWGSLVFVASWRHAYFRFLSNMNDRIYVTVVVTLNKLRRKLHTQQPPM
jgi:hypothetical protein